MVPTESRRPLTAALFAVALVLTSALAGVAVATPTAQDESPSETAQPTTADDTNGTAVVSEFRSTIGSLETVQMTRVTESTFDNETTETTTEIVADLEDSQFRSEIIDSEYTEGVVTVRNESGRVTYNPEENTVTRSDSYTDRMLPTVSALANESAVTYEYEGTTELNGEQVYELTGEPTTRTEAQSNASLTLFLDSETHFPAQLQMSSESDYGSYESTITFENVTLDAEIPDSRFDIDIPENATTPSFDEGPDISEYGSFDSFRSAANVTVPQPEMPADYQFEDARIIDGDSYYSASATYINGSDRVTVTINADESLIDFSEMDGYEEVDLGNTTGWHNSFDGARYDSLHWDCDGQAYTVFGDLQKETMIDIASSMACE